jgi:hypothetical protein
VIAWIISHSGVAETPPLAPSARGGLHGARLAAAAEERRVPRRYVLPAGMV